MHGRTGLKWGKNGVDCSDRTPTIQMAIHFSDAKSEPKDPPGRRFYPLNPVFYVVIATLILVSVVAGLPIGVVPTAAGVVLPALAAEDRYIVYVPLAAVVALWVLSGLLWRRTGWQILFCIGAIALTTFLIGFSLVMLLGSQH